MANIIGSPQQPHHALQGSRRTDLVVRAICLEDKVCLYGKVLISVNKLTCKVVLRRHGTAYDACRESPDTPYSADYGAANICCGHNIFTEGFHLN